MTSNTRPDLGMRELRPGGVSNSAFSPAISNAASTSNLVNMGSPMPENRPGVKASEILPLLNATKDKRSREERREGWKKCWEVVKNVLKVPVLLFLLYAFICSLDFLSTSFRLIAGKTAGTVFQGNALLSNPVVGLMIGILFTVLVQSSSTCTSVIVSMVSSGILNVRTAIPMVMGANVGTSLTSTLVSLTQVTDKVQFERAFAGATVHDCFNWLTVISLLTVEISTGYLYHVSYWMLPDLKRDSTQHINDIGVIHHSSQNGSQIEPSETIKAAAKATSINILGTLTKPFTKSIIQIDKSVIKCWSLGGCPDARLLKTEAKFLLNIPKWSDSTIGIILLVASLVILSTCLVLIVKVLRSALQGTVAKLLQKTLNSDIPYCPWLTGYVAIIAGAVLTFIVQSSSVFTATLTPLVGVGLINVDRVYPLTLGSNLGTTTTALLAALAASGRKNLRNALQIAICHFLFNFTGILLFYPIPAMRWPLTLCKILGKTTAKYRWFAIFYLTNMFFVVPGIVLGLSLAGNVIFFSVITPVVVIFFGVILVNVAQVKAPHTLPALLQNWDYLPKWMRSLEPMDWLLRTITCGFYCCTKYDEVEEDTNEIPATPPNSIGDYGAADRLQ